jgi:hypothetical protein
VATRYIDPNNERASADKKGDLNMPQIRRDTLALRPQQKEETKSNKKCC